MPHPHAPDKDVKMATTPIVDRRRVLPAAEPQRAGDEVRRPAVAALLAAGWALIYFSATSLRPPAHAPSLWYVVPETVFWGAAVTAGIGAARQWRAGAVAGLVAMVAVFACPLIGHHVVGLWFPVQLLGTAALAGANLVATEGRRPAQAVVATGDSTTSK